MKDMSALVEVVEVGEVDKVGNKLVEVEEGNGDSAYNGKLSARHHNLAWRELLGVCPSAKLTQ